MEGTSIEWATHSFNPWRGCSRVSKGCERCYAESQSKRNLKVLGQWGPNGTRVVANEAKWAEPAKWDRQYQEAYDEWHAHGMDEGPPPERPRVFCASMADVFEDWHGHMVDSQGDVLWFKRGSIVRAGQTTPCLSLGERTATMSDARARLFRLIHETPNLDWLLLTKRPENIAKHLAEYANRIDTYAAEAFSKVWSRRVWLGTSVENQDAADERIPHLLKVPAAVRFLSCEPLLGPVNLLQSDSFSDGEGGGVAYAIAGSEWDMGQPGIDWVIVGGESGHGARPCDVAWVRESVGQRRAAEGPV